MRYTGQLVFICSKCKTKKLISEFPKYLHKKKVLCFSSECKDCKNIRYKNYYYENLEQNRERSRKNASKQREKSKEKIYERVREWKSRNRKYCTNYNNNYDRKYPEKRKHRDSRVRFKRKLIIKRELKSHYTLQEWGYLKQSYNHTCLRCNKREPEIKLTPDHIIPLTKEFSSNSIDNIQPLCVSCNSSKNNKVIDYRPNGNIMAEVKIRKS